MCLFLFLFPLLQEVSYRGSCCDLGQSVLPMFFVFISFLFIVSLRTNLQFVILAAFGDGEYNLILKLRGRKTVLIQCEVMSHLKNVCNIFKIVTATTHLPCSLRTGTSAGTQSPLLLPTPPPQETIVLILWCSVPGLARSESQVFNMYRCFTFKLKPGSFTFLCVSEKIYLVFLLLNI